MKEYPVYLGKVSKIIMGQSPSSDAYNTEKKGLPFLQGCAEFGDKYPAPVKYCSIPLKVAPKGAVLVSVRAPVGDINIADQDYIIGRGLAAISGTSINQDLLPYLLDFVKPQLRQVAQGSTFEAISFDDLDKCLLPDLGNEKEQSKIAEVLTTIDRAIAQTESLIAKHQRIKTGLMQDLLTRGIDEYGQLRDSSTHKFKSTPLGMIPVEWDVKKAKQIVANDKPITYGIVQPGKYDQAGVLLVRGQDYINGWNDLSSFFKVSNSLHQTYKRSIIRPGDVLVCIVGATTGAVSIVPNWILEANITQTTARISPPPSLIDSSYLKFFLSSFQGQDQLKKIIKGSAQPGINLSDLEEVIIPIPHFEEQKRISQIFGTSLSCLESESGRLEKLKMIKQGLMQDLLSGEVSVTPLMEG